MEPQIERPRRHKRGLDRESEAVNVLKKLQNPIALVVQGFVAGGVLFWTTQGQASQAPASPAPVEASFSTN